MKLSVIILLSVLCVGVLSEEPIHGMVKKGTVDVGVVETTPFILWGRLMRLESIHSQYKNNTNPGRKPYLRIRDVANGNVSSGFGINYQFGSALTVGSTVYVFGTDKPVSGGGNHIQVFWSDDLVNWSTSLAVSFPNGTETSIRSFNNDVWPGEINGTKVFVMPIELGSPPKIVGHGFTIGFAITYSDTPNEGWQFLDPSQYIYTKKYYSACPAIWYLPSTQYWYMIYLRTWSNEPYKVYAEDMVRSKDLLNWEESTGNPFLWKTAGDTIIAQEGDVRLSSSEKEHIKNCTVKDINASDIDFIEITEPCIGCPPPPAVYINYNWGDQKSDCEFLAAAIFNGTAEQYFTQMPFL